MRQALGSITGWDFQLESSARTLFLVSSPTPGGIGRGFNSRIVHVFFEAQKYTTADSFCPHVHKTIVRQNHDMRLLVLGICLTWCTYFLKLRSTLRRILFTHTFTKPLSDKTRTCVIWCLTFVGQIVAHPKHLSNKTRNVKKKTHTHKTTKNLGLSRPSYPAIRPIGHVSNLLLKTTLETNDDNKVPG